MSAFSDIDIHIQEILEKYIANPLIDEINETGGRYQIDSERYINTNTRQQYARFIVYIDDKKFLDIARDLPPYKTIKLHRNPTQSEIKRGYGAIHYLDYPLQLLQKKGGGLKKWTVSRFDGLRYYL
jgi:hypothetical protein